MKQAKNWTGLMYAQAPVHELGKKSKKIAQFIK